MAGLVVAAALVMDFGVIRIDRQANKLAADDAVMAGLRAGDKGTTALYSEEAVCGALEFLQVNRPDFNTLPDNNCAGHSTTATCNATSPFTYTGSVSLPRRSYTVTIQSPFEVNNGDPRFPEDNYASVSSDNSTLNGCASSQVGNVFVLKR